MRKIPYPKDPIEIKKFHDCYLEKVKPSNIDEINCYLNQIIIDKQILSFNRLVLFDFEKLMEIKDKMHKFSLSHNTKSANIFNELFDYSSKQQNIAKFFREQKIMNFKTCFYCNIDFINSFADMKDYIDEYDFLNYAPKYELKLIENLGDIIADKIIEYRERSIINASNIKDLKLSDKILNRIQQIDINHSHDHFTLDHFLPQSKYPFFTLCLYNLIPSCYSCNSKFKKANSLPKNGNWSRVSPSSHLFSLDTDLEFRVFFKKSSIILSEEDIVIKKNISKGEEEVLIEYLKMFKIEGRYLQHKDVVFEILKKCIEYPESKIQEISNKLNISKKEVKQLVFGKEIFESNNDIPLIKLKKDIAKSMGIT